jgi:hypothetical protein
LPIYWLTTAKKNFHILQILSLTISVAWTVVGKETRTEAIFIENKSEIDFINEWIIKMFQEGQEIYDIRQEQIAKLDLPPEVEKRLISRRETNIRILGYNNKNLM